MQFEVNDVINAINGILFSEYVVYALLATGLIFYTYGVDLVSTDALTHGISVIQGKIRQER